MRTRRTVVLSGAGVSTESGIPDYRGPDSPRRERAPISYQEFVGDAGARRRYWARSSVGWPRFTAARPNPGHEALSRLEAAGYVSGVITQNVDGLHQAAGSADVVELHGALADVRCLRCGRRTDRTTYQRRLLQSNPGWPPEAATLAPDGDAVLPDAATTSFRVPGCLRCGGILKPDVVFFGESVPRRWVDAAWDLFDRAEMLLVVGSSLAVYSGLRFVRRAANEARPVGIVNLGPTRGDAHARLRIDGRTGTLLPRLAETMGV
jgi:NAD-dependent SIR2 family protein deacetylase